MSGYVDLQVNGYAGVDFNSDSLDERSVIEVCQRLRRDGVDQILATIITAPLEQMIHRINAIATWINTIPEVRDVIAGLHVEGPFLNPGKGFVGAHPVASVLRATVDVADRLIDAGQSYVKILTLAPECDSDSRVIRSLVRQGVIVSAGHSDVSIAELDQAIEAGLTMFTHLGNGCPANLQRHDNIVSRVLSRSDQLKISFIADGHHVPMFALANYAKIVPPENLIIVSDAISAAGLGPGEHYLSGQRVLVDPDGAAWASCRTHFAGCATTLQESQRILLAEVTSDQSLVDTWMRINPSKLLRSAG